MPSVTFTPGGASGNQPPRRGPGVTFTPVLPKSQQWRRDEFPRAGNQDDPRNSPGVRFTPAQQPLPAPQRRVSSPQRGIVDFGVKMVPGAGGVVLDGLRAVDGLAGRALNVGVPRPIQGAIGGAVDRLRQGLGGAAAKPARPAAYPGDSDWRKDEFPRSENRNDPRNRPAPPAEGPVTDPRNQGQLDALRREMARRNGAAGGGGGSATTPPPPPVLPPPTTGSSSSRATPASAVTPPPPPVLPPPTRNQPPAAASPVAAGAGVGAAGPAPAPAAAASRATALPQSPGTSIAGGTPAPQFRFDSSAPDAGDVGRPGFYKPPTAGTPEAAAHQSDMSLIRSAYAGSLHLDDNLERAAVLRSPQAAGDAGSTALIGGGADPKIPIALEPGTAPGAHGAMGPTGSPGFDRVSNTRDTGGFDSIAKQQMLGDAARNMGDLEGTDLGNQLSSYLNEAAAAAAPDAGDVAIPVGHKAADGSTWTGSSWGAPSQDAPPSSRYVSPKEIGDAMGSDRFISGLKGIGSPTALTSQPSVYSEAQQGPAGFSIDHALAAAANVPGLDMSKVLGPDYFRNAQLFGDRDGGISGIVRKMPPVKVDPKLTNRIRLANLPPI